MNWWLLTLQATFTKENFKSSFDTFVLPYIQRLYVAKHTAVIKDIQDLHSQKLRCSLLNQKERRISIFEHHWKYGKYLISINIGLMAFLKPSCT